MKGFLLQQKTTRENILFVSLNQIEDCQPKNNLYTNQNDKTVKMLKHNSKALIKNNLFRCIIVLEVAKVKDSYSSGCAQKQLLTEISCHIGCTKEE